MNLPGIYERKFTLPKGREYVWVTTYCLLVVSCPSIHRFQDIIFKTDQADLILVKTSLRWPKMWKSIKSLYYPYIIYFLWIVFKLHNSMLDHLTSMFTVNCKRQSWSWKKIIQETISSNMISYKMTWRELYNNFLFLFIYFFGFFSIWCPIM